MIRTARPAGIPRPQIQHEHPGRAAHRPNCRVAATPIYSTWKFKEAQAEPAADHAPAAWTRTRTGSASRIFSIAWFRWPTSTRCASPATRTIRACRPKAYQGVDARAGNGRRAEEVRHDARESLSRAELLPGHGLRDAARIPGRDLRRDPLVRLAARRSSTCISAISAGGRDDFVRGVPGRGRCGFRQGHQVYKEVGYPYMLMPDHVPLAADDPARCNRSRSAMDTFGR